MLLRQKMNDMSAQTMIRLGMGMFLVGMALANIGRLQLGLPDFWSGFAIGMAIVMLGASIVFNVRGFARARAERKR